MFKSFYYDWTMAEAAKNAAQPHCCWVPKMKVHQPLQNSCKNTFPNNRNKFGSNKTYLSMFNSFYYDWTLAEAAKNAAQQHCWLGAKYEGAPTKSKLLQINLHWLV